MTQPDWDDERLDAAFHARFDRPAPTGLAKDIHVRIAGTSPGRFRFPRVGHPWSLAAAAVVVIVVGAATFGQSMLSLPSGPAVQPSASTSQPGASATATGQALPASVFGLPIVSVSDAIAVRDFGTDDDSELAVRGWFTPAPPAHCSTPPMEPVTPVQVRCPDDLVWLTEDAESLVHTTETETETLAPRSLALHPLLDGLETDWFPKLPEAGSEGVSTPVEVVFVGHFGDRRAGQCQDVEIPACRDRFVVDSVAFVDGVEHPMSRLRMTIGIRSSDAVVAAVVANEAPDSQILSTTVVSGPGGLVDLEPSLGTGQAGLVDQRALWIVRVLESGRVSTYIVIDGSDAIYEMNPEGEAILVGGTPPTSEATASPDPWPPVAARTIDLTSEVGAGQPPVSVAVVDQSGRLDGVTEKGTVDPATRTLDRRIEAYAEPDVSPGRVHLAWVGSICDSQITITVAQDLRTIFFDMGPPVDCDSIGIGRELVLDFSGDVDSSQIELVDATGRPHTEVDPPSYALDCGTIEHDACLAMVADIVAVNPNKRVTSITFQGGECGSYKVTFADGIEETTMLYCPASPEPS